MSFNSTSLESNHQSLYSYKPSSPVKIESSSTRHIAQWESIRVEAEARLSMESVQTNHDIFLSLWNSEVGKSFRKNSREGGEVHVYPPIKLESRPFCTVQARATGTSSTSSSMETSHEVQEDDIYRPNVEPMMAGSDSMSSNNDFPDSSDATAALKLLLDFPGGGDNSNMEFLHDQTKNVSDFLNFQCD
ncbi:hypothetical protein JRO89_XS11G0192200 [Xanthoceras sorbifolium]|uniref:Uncharacterized protein n=1 Tax=Xanthoceras sorbifolium TaxID=99658 RepID=A0ABQ8HG82_9ROSI|nr:hypothetical protein JRO89_XS11G0192200 [Xanthoceras sorbifolium]